MEQENWVKAKLFEIQRSVTLQQYFTLARSWSGQYQRRRVTEIPWSEEIEKLIMEWILARYIARRDRQFERADAYRHVLERLGFDVLGLDMELSPPRNPELLKTKGGQVC